MAIATTLTSSPLLYFIYQRTYDPTLEQDAGYHIERIKHVGDEEAENAGDTELIEVRFVEDEMMMLPMKPPVPPLNLTLEDGKGPGPDDKEEEQGGSGTAKHSRAPTMVQQDDGTTPPESLNARAAGVHRLSPHVSFSSRSRSPRFHAAMASGHASPMSSRTVLVPVPQAFLTAGHEELAMDALMNEPPSSVRARRMSRSRSRNQGPPSSRYHGPSAVHHRHPAAAHSMHSRSGAQQLQQQQLYGYSLSPQVLSPVESSTRSPAIVIEPPSSNVPSAVVPQVGMHKISTRSAPPAIRPSASRSDLMMAPPAVRIHMDGGSASIARSLTSATSAPVSPNDAARSVASVGPGPTSAAPAAAAVVAPRPTPLNTAHPAPTESFATEDNSPMPIIHEQE